MYIMISLITVATCVSIMGDDTENICYKMDCNFGEPDSYEQVESKCSWLKYSQVLILYHI